MPVCCGCSGLNVVPMGRRGRLECVTFWRRLARLRTPRLVCWDGCGVCYVCVEYVDAFVDTAPGLPG